MKIFSRIFLCCLVLAGVTECQTGWTQEGIPGWKKAEQHFIFNNGTEPKSIDPHVISGLAEMRITEALFEGLVSYDPKTLEPRPGVAESWKISDDWLIYTFTLRRNAKWSDGKTITANDFLLSWKRVLTRETASPYTNLLYSIKGAEEYYRGKIKDFSGVGVRVIDPFTLEVCLKAPCSYFLDLMAFTTLYPVRVDLIEKHKNQWTKPENIVSNGAFVLKKWLPRQKIVLEKNPCYWDRDFVKLSRVTIKPLEDSSTAYKLFLEKELHWLQSVPTGKIDEVKRSPDYYASPFLGTYFYRFNVTRAPFDDVRVRRAFSMAIDRTEITNHLLRGGQKPQSFYCPDVAGYKSKAGLNLDIKTARRLLRKAGYGSGGKKFPVVEIIYNTSEAHKMVAEALAQQWKQALGVTVNARNMEWKTYLSEMKELKYQIARSSWIGDYNDPDTFFNIFRTGDGNNRTGWSSKLYDELLLQSQIEPNPDKRLKLFHAMEKILVEEECPIMPIYGYVNQGLLSESVMGWYENIRDIHPLKYIWMEKF